MLLLRVYAERVERGSREASFVLLACGCGRTNFRSLGVKTNLSNGLNSTSLQDLQRCAATCVFLAAFCELRKHPGWRLHRRRHGRFGDRRRRVNVIGYTVLDCIR